MVARADEGGGAYYLQAPKIGSLFQAGSAKPFDDYPVTAKWIFQLVQMQKITFSAARAELVKTGENLCRVLPDFDRRHAESTAARLHQRAAAVQDMLRSTDCRSVRVPEVEAWKARYGRGVWRRKKFLVLEGPSGTGKTEFVRGLYGALQTLELNCAGLVAVNLRDYKPFEHKVVLWDEASPELVLTNRKLFQCPPHAGSTWGTVPPGHWCTRSGSTMRCLSLPRTGGQLRWRSWSRRTGSGCRPTRSMSMSRSRCGSRRRTTSELLLRLQSCARESLLPLGLQSGRSEAFACACMQDGVFRHRTWLGMLRVWVMN